MAIRIVRGISLCVVSGLALGRGFDPPPGAVTQFFKLFRKSTMHDPNRRLVVFLICSKVKVITSKFQFTACFSKKEALLVKIFLPKRLFSLNICKQDWKVCSNYPFCTEN